METTTARVSVPEGVLFRDLAGEAVLLELESGRYYGLNETGTRMWSLLAEHERVEEVLEVLFQEYDAPPERLRQELHQFIATLASRKLLNLHEN